MMKGERANFETVFHQQYDVWTAFMIDNFLSFYVYCFHTGTAFVRFGHISCRRIVFCLFFYNLQGDENALYHSGNSVCFMAARPGDDPYVGRLCASVTDRGSRRAAFRPPVGQAFIAVNPAGTGNRQYGFGTFAVPKSAAPALKHMTNRFQWNIV